MIFRPIDDYDPRWPLYWAAHPELLRAVGADATGQEGGEAEGGKPEGAAGKGDESPEGDGGDPEAGGKPASDSGGEGTEGKEPDWRESVTDEKLREHARRFTSLDDLVRGNVTLRSERDQLRTKAAVPPDKDAGEEEIADFRKKMGVPGSPEGYEFPAPPEGQELTEDEKTSRETWAQRFHEHNVPKATAEALIEVFRQDMEQARQAQTKADEDFARQSETELRQEWKGEDFEKNRNLARRAVDTLVERAGVDANRLTALESKDGKLVMDHPVMLRLFAAIGREMAEGTLGGTMTEGERETANEELRTLLGKINEAQARGDHAEANKLYQREQEMLARMHGNRPVVGSEGRAA